MYKRIFLLVIFSFFFAMTHVHAQEYLSQDEIDFIELVTKNSTVLLATLERGVIDVNHQFGSKKETLLMILVRKLIDKHIDLDTNASRLGKNIGNAWLVGFCANIVAISSGNEATIIGVGMFNGFMVALTAIYVLSRNDQNTEIVFGDNYAQIDLLLSKPELNINCVNTDGKTALEILSEGTTYVGLNGSFWLRLYILQGSFATVMRLAGYPKVES